MLWLKSPLAAVPLVLLTVSVFWHLRLGLQVFIEDYVHEEGSKIAALLLLNAYAIGAATLCVFSILKIAFGGVLDVTKGGKHVTTVTTTRNFYPSQDPADGLVGKFFDTSDSDSAVGLDAGLRRDIWTVINVQTAPLAALINQGNTVFANYAKNSSKRVTGFKRTIPIPRYSFMPIGSGDSRCYPGSTVCGRLLSTI